MAKDSSDTAHALVARLEAELRALGTKERAVAEQAYLKSTLVHFGVPVPTTRKVVLRALRDHPALTRTELQSTVQLSWKRGVHELRMAAVELLDARNDLLRAGDMKLLERLIRQSGTWALVDGLAASVTGKLVERLPALARTLDRWAKHDDFWVRRAAMLALLGPLRRGGGDFERFGRYADAMLDETEFFIRKAIGWVLRETSKKRPALVTRWLLPRASRASGVTMREAVKYLSARDRERLLRAQRVRVRHARSRLSRR